MFLLKKISSNITYTGAVNLKNKKMNLKTEIQSRFISAIKNGDTGAKNALASLKTKITEFEKQSGSSEISDNDVLKIITNQVKQRQQSFEAYDLAARKDLAQKEMDEMEVLKALLPAQMSTDEIRAELTKIVSSLPEGLKNNPNALKGKTLGEFNKLFPGRADVSVVTEEISKMI